MQEMQEMQVSSLGEEDAPGEEMAALVNPMDRGAWLTAVNEVVKS